MLRRMVNNDNTLFRYLELFDNDFRVNIEMGVWFDVYDSVRLPVEEHNCFQVRFPIANNINENVAAVSKD